MYYMELLHEEFNFKYKYITNIYHIFTWFLKKITILESYKYLKL